MKTMKTKTKKKDLTEEAFLFLAPKNPLGHYWSDLQYTAMLTSYKKNKGNKALRALAGFYVWVEKNVELEKQGSLLASTFAHDLGQQDDKWMHPRSSSYLKFWKDNKTK